jgi:hypothetical protein
MGPAKPVWPDIQKHSEQLRLHSLYVFSKHLSLICPFSSVLIVALSRCHTHPPHFPKMLDL